MGDPDGDAEVDLSDFKSQILRRTSIGGGGGGGGTQLSRVASRLSFLMHLQRKSSLMASQDTSFDSSPSGMQGGKMDIVCAFCQINGGSM